MKEFVNKVSQAVRSEMGASHAAAGLTKPEAVTYARSGEIYMAAEPGKQEAPKPKARGKIRRFLFGEGDEAHEQPQQQQERKNGEPEAHARHQQKRADTTPESSENPKKELTVKERLAAVKEVVDLVHDLPHASAAVKNPHAAEIIDRSNSEAGKTLRQAFLNLDNPQVLKTATEDEFATIEHLKERILREADARDIPRELITEDSDKTDTIPDVPDAKEIESLFEELYDLDPQRAALKAAAARAAEEMPDEVKETLEQQRQAYTERMAAEGVTNAANMQARAEPEEEPEPAPQFDLTGITDFQLRQRANQINRTLEQLHSEDMIDLDYVNQASQLISSVEIKNRKGMKEDPIADAQREHQDRLVSELAALRIRVLKEKKAAEDAEMKKRYEQRRLEQRYGSDERDVQDMAAGLDITKANLLLDQGIREQVFANIFANVDATPHEQFRELFDPFTFGRFYKTFIKILREGRDMKPEDFMKQFQNYLLADMLERKDVNATLSKYLRIIISQRRPGLSPEQVDEQVAGALRAQWKNEEKADGKREEQIKFSDTVLNNELLKEAWSRMHGDIIEDFDRFQNERQMREHLHDANSVLYRARVPADALFGYIEQLGNNLADTGFRADGVKQMMDLYESVIRRNIAKKDGYLDPEDIMGRIEGRGGTAEHPKFYAQIAKPVMETETKALFVEMVTAGLIYTTREDGVQVRVTNVQPWEVDRIYTIARGMMVASMRLLSLATESRIPKEQRFTSLAFQDLLQGYSGYRKHLQGKYFVGEGALAIYVMGKRSKILGRLNMPWSTKEAYAKFINMKDNITEILDDEIGAEINLRKDNPNRFGDVFTMIGGWRADPESIGKNATSAMLQAGRGRMVRRILSNGEIQRCIFGNTLNLDGIPTTGSDEAEAR
ncbi:MAG TPA: hypothetical protein VJC10_04200, partial [Patescibacteria group bacterium]|nr:hypothetical protein [Patescibacteria group bacterium]